MAGYWDIKEVKPVIPDADHSIIYLRNPIGYVAIVRCSFNCRIYAAGNRSLLLADVKRGDTGTFELPHVTDALYIEWDTIGWFDPVASTEFPELILWVSQTVSHHELQPKTPQLDDMFNPPPSFSAGDFGFNINYGIPVVVSVAASPNLTGFYNALYAAGALNYADDSIPAAGLYAWNPASAQFERLDGTAANGLEVDVTRMPNVVISSLPNVVISSMPAVVPKRVSTYSAVFKLATRPFPLSHAFAAAGRKQYGTLYKTSAQNVTVRLLSCRVAVESVSVACVVGAELRRLTATTTPATGNPAITPQAHLPSDTPQATALALPTTAGNEGNLIAFAHYNLGVTAGGSTVNPPPAASWVELLPSVPFGDLSLLEARAANNEGFCLTLDCSAAATVDALVMMTWTEE